MVFLVMHKGAHCLNPNCNQEVMQQQLVIIRRINLQKAKMKLCLDIEYFE